MFVKASCGCIVIPSEKPSERLVGHVQCVLIKACDGDSSGPEWCFNHRDMESWKVKEDPDYPYGNRTDKPVQLNHAQSKMIVQAIGKMIYMGHSAMEINSSLAYIARTRTELPNAMDFAAAGEVG